MPEGNTSIKWKLSWQLSLVFITVVASVIIGLCVYGAFILSPNVGIEHKIEHAMAEAVGRDPQGKLQVRDTSRLMALKNENSRLWYVVMTADGASSVSYGTIPAPYAEIAQHVHRFQEADIRGSVDTDEIASIETVATSIGNVKIIYGGNSGRYSPFLAVMTGMYPIYVPLLALALPAIFLAVPRMVRHALAGLNNVVQKATEIEPRQQGSRLPTRGVPKEVLPLVVAFNGVLERLEHEFQKRQRFLIDAAHELRTPITIMQTRIEATLEGEERERLLKDIARLAQAAEQLLDFERNDQTTDLYEMVDLVELTKTVVADLAPVAIAAGYEIAFQSEVDRLFRRGSFSALERALNNLVRNAIEHGGNVGLISVSVSGGGQITVEDQGPGIPLDQQELVFEPFYRVTPRSTGAGLGLSLVRQIVTNHGGRVAIASKPAGTKLTMYL
jgi:signal transduction histidine kinase